MEVGRESGGVEFVGGGMGGCEVGGEGMRDGGLWRGRRRVGDGLGMEKVVITLIEGVLPVVETWTRYSFQIRIDD